MTNTSKIKFACINKVIDLLETSNFIQLINDAQISLIPFPKFQVICLCKYLFLGVWYNTIHKRCFVYNHVNINYGWHFNNNERILSRYVSLLYGNWILNQTSSGPLSHDIALGSGWLQLNRHKDNKDIDPVALIPVFFIWYNWDRRIHWLTFFSLTALSSPATRFRVQLTKFAFRTLSSHNSRAELLNATIWNELTNPRYSLLCLNRFVLEATTEDNILTNNWTCETDHYQYRRKYVSSSLASTFWFMVWSHV